jgi:aldose 1-epimerase
MCVLPEIYRSRFEGCQRAVGFVVLFFAFPFMTPAANYSAQKLTVDSVDIVRLTDAAHKIEVSICPSVGNIAYDMTINGKQILLPPYAALPEWKAKPGQSGIPFLAPWANRLDQDAYWANGHKYVLNPETATLRRDQNNHPIHGLLLFAEWQVVKLNADRESAEVTSRLEFWKHPGWMAQFPFAHTIEMTYRLAAGVLEVRTTIENHSLEPMPLVIGFHPWYQIPEIPRDEWTIHAPVREHYTLSSAFIPTGEKKQVGLPDPTPLLGRQFDDVYGGIKAGEEFWVEAKGRRISVRFGPNFPIAVVYAPQSKNVVCFEPMTAITNAFNLAHEGVYQGLPSIAPGAKWTESFWLRASGF